jgi:hypothetical protein
VKRLLLVLMLALLPLQSVWASAARYCSHEGSHETAAPQHLGHHEHEHAAPAAASLPDGAGADLDCAVCHLACCVSLPIDFGFEVPPVRPPLCERACSGFRSFTAAIPDRPDIAGTAIAVRSGGVPVVC